MEQALNLIQIIQDTVLRPDWWSALSIFLVSIVNEVVAVFPYAIVLAGQLLFLEEPLTFALAMKLVFFVAVPVGLGSAVGSLLIYGLAYFGGKPAIERYHQYLHFSWSDVEKVNARFKGAWYDEIIFLLLRSLPVLPSLPVNVAAGVFRMRFWPYFVLSTVGFTLRMVLTMAIFGIGLSRLSQFFYLFYNI